MINFSNKSSPDPISDSGQNNNLRDNSYGDFMDKLCKNSEEGKTYVSSDNSSENSFDLNNYLENLIL